MNQIIRNIKGNKITKLNLQNTLNHLSNLERDSILKKICNAFEINTILLLLFEEQQ